MAQITLPASDQESRARMRVGWLLQERWRLEALIGVGGMAAVYRASHKNGRSAAIKMLHIELSQIEEVKERFLDEGYASNSVKHSGTVEVLDDGVGPDGATYLVMELLEGETLEERLSRSENKLPPLDVLALVEPLLEVIVAAHQSGIVHRDIKPENIFLTRSGIVKLLDFGIARMTDSRRSSRTQSGATLGTLAYMSPEQARGRWEQLDARSDLFSVGATMFTLLTGDPIHQGETNNELLLAAMTLQAPPVATVVPGIASELAALVDCALEFEPDARFQTADEMLQAVRSTRLILETRYSQHGYSSRPPVAGEHVGPMFAGDGKSTYRPVMISEDEPLLPERQVWPFLAVACLLVVGTVLSFVWAGSTPTDAPELSHSASAHSPVRSDAPEERLAPEPEPESQVVTENLLAAPTSTPPTLPALKSTNTKPGAAASANAKPDVVSPQIVHQDTAAEEGPPSTGALPKSSLPKSTSSIPVGSAPDSRPAQVSTEADFDPLSLRR